VDAEAACSVVVQVIGGEVREELRPLPKEYNNSLLLRCGVVEAVGRQLAIEAKHYAETIKVGQGGVTGRKGQAWVVRGGARSFGEPRSTGGLVVEDPHCA
jgi:hypothetical protein